MWTPEKIKVLRSEYGETQAEFCMRLRVSLSALRQWERGASRPIGPAELLLDRLQEDILKGEPRKLQPA